MRIPGSHGGERPRAFDEGGSESVSAAPAATAAQTAAVVRAGRGARESMVCCQAAAMAEGALQMLCLAKAKLVRSTAVALVLGAVAVGEYHVLADGNEDSSARSVATPPGPGTVAEAPGRWLNLLETIDTERDTVAGGWEMVDGVLKSQRRVKHKLIQAPVRIDGSYRLQLRFVRRAGIGGLHLTIPVGTGRATVKLAGEDGRTWTALEQIEGKIYYEAGNPTRTDRFRITDGREHTVDLIVRIDEETADVSIGADGQNLVKWAGKVKALAIHPMWKLRDDHVVGFGTWATQIEITQARLQILGQGLARPLHGPASGTESGARSGPVDLLALFELDRDTIKGKWTRGAKGMLTSESGDRLRAQLPVKANGDYKLRVRLSRPRGDESVAIYLPVGDRSCQFIVGGKWRPTRCGFQSIHGRSAEFPDASAAHEVENGRVYVVDLSVRVKGDVATLGAQIDGNSLVNWTGPLRAISVSPGWYLSNRNTFGLGVYSYPWQFHEMKLTMLSGEAVGLDGQNLSPGAPTPETASDPIDLLAQIDPKRDSVAGGWTLTPGPDRRLESATPGNFRRLRIPVIPQGHYELLFSARRLSEHGGMTVILPVARGRQAELKLGDATGAGASGVSMADRQKNPTVTDRFKIGNARDHQVRVTVKPAVDDVAISVQVDGSTWIDWSGPMSALGRDQARWTIRDPNTLGLGMHRSNLRIGRLRLKMLTGRAIDPGGRVIDQAGPAAAKVATAAAIDLLKLIDPTTIEFEGEARRRDDGRLNLRGGRGIIQAPVQPKGSYRIDLEFVRSMGQDTPYVLLPVGEGWIVLQLKGGGIRTLGIGGEVSSGTAVNLPAGRKHSVSVEVRKRGTGWSISGRANDQPFGPWQGGTFSGWGSWKAARTDVIGLGVYQASVDVHRFELSMLDGKAVNLAGRTVARGGSVAVTPPIPPAPVAAMSAEEAQKLFDQLFGDGLSRVKSTPQPADDVELANQMLDVARTSGEDARLLGLMLDHARELTAKTPGGYATAVEASRRLMETWPEKRDEVLDSLLEIRRRQYAVARGEDKTTIGREWLSELIDGAVVRGDAGNWNEAIALYVQAVGLATRVDPDRKPGIQQDLGKARELQRLHNKVAQLKRALKDNPRDKQRAGELLRLLVVDLDDPAEARKFTFLAEDGPLKDNIPLAAKETQALNEDQARTLARWYHDLSREAAPQAKVAMFTRARDCYQRYLDLHGRSDLQGKAAELALKNIDADLTKLEAPSQGASTRPGGRRQITFVADQSMQLFQVGGRQGNFPVQATDDARGPFAGKGVYFRQSTGRDVYYQVQWPRPVTEIYWKGAAMSRMKIEVLDTRGNVVASSGPHNQGNVWGEFRLQVPRNRAMRRFVLHLYNGASTWYYVDTIQFR